MSALAVRAFMRSLSDGLNRLVTAVSALLVVTMFTISLIGIFHKFVFGSPLSWAFSINRLILPWFAMLSLTVAFKAGDHIAMTVLVKRLPRAARRAVDTFNFLMVVFFSVALAWYGYAFFVGSNQFFMVSDLLQVSGRWSAAAVPICGLVFCVHLASGLTLVDHGEFGTEDPS